MPFISNGTSTQEYDNYITAHHEYLDNEDERRVAEGIAAAAAGVFALYLADKMFDIQDDALDKEFDIRNQIFDLQKIYIDHWCDVEFPQKQLVADTIYGLSAESPDYGNLLGLVRTQGMDTSQSAHDSIHDLNFKNRVDCGAREGCVTDAQVMAEVAIAQASHYLFRYEERRFYSEDNDYRKLAASVNVSLQFKPDQAFNLLASAASLYSTIGASAALAGTGAASAAGQFFGYAGGALSPGA